MSGFLVQSRHGRRGNFEVVVPPTHGAGLTHLWRNNDVDNFPWSAPICFGRGNMDSACLIQGNFGSTGNLEVVARESDRLDFYWRMDRAPWTWGGPFTIGAGARGNPALIQSRHGRKGNFELVVPHIDGGLMHMWRDNDNPALPWSGPSRFGSGRIDGVALIQGNFGSPGNLELLAVEGERLVFYWRMDRAPWTWGGPFTIAAGVRGVPALIQSRHGTKGNFEAIIPHRDGGLVHLWRNNDNPALPWSGAFRFGSGLYDEVSCIQGNFGSPGNLEVVARGNDGRLDFYWRMDRSPWTWSGPFLIGAERAWDVSECVYGWRAAFFQSDAHVIGRIQLSPDSGISAATMDTLRTTWRNGIINKWSNLFDCRAPNGETRRLTVDVHWVASGAHHVVRVRPGPQRSNMTNWDTSDTGDVASHEFGHMLGHPDEYNDSACPARSPVSTGTVMDDNTEVVERQVEHLASFNCGHDAGPVAASEPEEVSRSPMRSLDELDAAERGRFVEHMREAPDRDEGKDHKVTFVVAGGAPGDRYEYRAEVHADRTADVSLLDEMNARSEQESDLALDPDQVQTVFERAVSEDVLEASDSAPQLVPDSLVGTIIVTNGDVEKRIFFAVEESQGRAREPGEADVALLATPDLLIRQEYATPGVRSLVEAIQSIPNLMR